MGDENVNPNPTDSCPACISAIPDLLLFSGYCPSIGGFACFLNRDPLYPENFIGTLSAPYHTIILTLTFCYNGTGDIVFLLRDYPPYYQHQWQFPDNECNCDLSFPDNSGAGGRLFIPDPAFFNFQNGFVPSLVALNETLTSETHKRVFRTVNTLDKTNLKYKIETDT